ncbi:MAG: efflux RND transporter periplasmic adaptor subunit [Gammaproteobacteria bacterium]|nr:efflux RND transporter periplasmic adaptor subunit [Gammaproteobacteria bacterium]MDH5728728.1 efflux RND transporter periplasmic adaptor subunit [Gammaproteobacteria bacterium]
MKNSIKFILCVCCVLPLTLSYAEDKKKKGPPAAPVVVAEVAQTLLAPSVLISGTVTARQRAQIPAELAGRVTWVADVGSKIQQGQVIARLDDGLYQLEVLELQASLKREAAKVKFLEQEMIRIKELSKENFAAQSHQDKLQSDLEIGKSEYAVVKAKARLAQERLDRLQLRAPFNGVVANHLKRRGEWVANGESVVLFSNPGDLEIEAQVSENSVNHIRQGDKINVKIGEENHQADVRAIVPVGDQRSLLYDLRLAIKGSQWRAGQAVRVLVPTGAPRMVKAVPRDALVLRRTSTSVFRIVDQDTAQRVEVTTGIAAGDLIEVNGDLNPGESVVIRGSERLRPGQKVRIVNTQRGIQ